MKFKYLSIEISGYGDDETEACLNHSFWHNKYIIVETKSRIYKPSIRPILTYKPEIIPETSKAKQISKTTKMKVLHRITEENTNRSRKDQIPVQTEVRYI